MALGSKLSDADKRKAAKTPVHGAAKKVEDSIGHLERDIRSNIGGAEQNVRDAIGGFLGLNKKPARPQPKKKSPPKRKSTAVTSKGRHGGGTNMVAPSKKSVAKRTKTTKTAAKSSKKTTSQRHKAVGKAAAKVQKRNPGLSRTAARRKARAIVKAR